MKAYWIDEISESDMKRIREYLRANASPSGLDRVFWVRIPEGILSEVQRAHPGCQPHAFALELGAGSIKAELFVRSLATLRCTCPAYATEAQKTHIHSFVDAMLARLGVPT